MSGPCLQHINESTSTQVTYNIETLNQHHEEYDQTARGILVGSFSEAVGIEQSGLTPAAEASVLPVPDGQPNNKLEGNEVDEHNCSYDKRQTFTKMFAWIRAVKIVIRVIYLL